MAAGEQASTVKAALENLLKRDVKSHCELLQRKTQNKQSKLLVVTKEQLMQCPPQRKELQETFPRRVLTQATQEAPATKVNKLADIERY